MAGEARDVQAQLRGPELAGWPSRRYHEADQNRVPPIFFTSAVQGEDLGA